MRRPVMAAMLVATILFVLPRSIVAQTEGSIRGYIRDEQAAVLPGVSIIATSPDAAAPYRAVSTAGAPQTGPSNARYSTAPEYLAAGLAARRVGPKRLAAAKPARAEV